MGAVLAVASIAVAPALAAPPICERAVALRVNQRGLDFIVSQVKPLIPKSLEVPAIDQVVVDWPLTESDARVQISPMTAKLDLKELKVFMDGGAVYLQGLATVSTGGPVKVLNPYAGLGSADCQADVNVVDLTLQVGARLDAATGKTRVELTAAKIDLDNEKSVIALKGCALGNILTSVTSFVRKHFMGTIQEKVEAIAKEKVPPLLEAKLNETIAYSGELKGYSYQVALAGLTTDESGVGALLSGGVGVASQVVPTCLKEVPPAALVAGPCQAQTPALYNQTDAMFGAGLSEALLQQGLHAVWRSGLLCIDSRSLTSPTVGQTLSKLAASLGQPAGTQLNFQLRLAAAPAVRFSRAAGVTVELKGIGLDISLEPPVGEPGRVAISADLAASGEPWIDPASNSIALDLKAMSVGRLQILGVKGLELGLDPARLQRFVAEVALPVVQTKLQGLQLSPAVISALNLVFVELKQIQTGDGYLAAYLDAHTLLGAAPDKQAPETQIVKAPGPVVSPQVVQALVAGSDDQTPPGLLRYKARIDGGAWSEPSFNRRVDLVTHGGVHQVEIAAIDLQGNVDPTPAKVELKVDALAPELTITARPESIIGETAITIGFAGSDDLTPAPELAYSAELYRMPSGGGAPELIQSRLFESGISSASFDRLEEGVYKARVIARDSAGNVTSKDVGFTVNLDGGCALAGAPAHADGVLLGLLLALFVVCARRSRRTR